MTSVVIRLCKCSTFSHTPLQHHVKHVTSSSQLRARSCSFPLARGRAFLLLSPDRSQAPLPAARWTARNWVRVPGCSPRSPPGDMADTVADTRRLHSKPQNLNDAYGPPSNFLEIDVSNPQTVGVGRNRFTTYEIRLKVRPVHPGDCDHQGVHYRRCHYYTQQSTIRFFECVCVIFFPYGLILLDFFYNLLFCLVG